MRDRQADLVVLDANLPLEDVREILRQLEQEGLRTRSLVLATTNGQVRQALAAGADAVLRRDSSIRKLSEAVDGLHQANPREAKESDRKMFPEDIEA